MRASSHLAWGGPALLAGALLLALALPIAGASLIRLPAGPVLEDIRAGKAVSAPALRRARAILRRALAWREQPRGYFDLALLHLATAQSAGDDRRNRHLRAAERALLRGLALAPVKPAAWSRLALVRYRLARPSSDVVAALRLAIATGPDETALAPARAELILRLWPRAARRIDRAALRDQLRLAWRVDSRFTRVAARASGRPDVLRRALAGSRDAARRRDPGRPPP